MNEQLKRIERMRGALQKLTQVIDDREVLAILRSWRLELLEIEQAAAESQRIQKGRLQKL